MKTEQIMKMSNILFPTPIEVSLETPIEQRQSQQQQLEQVVAIVAVELNVASRR